MIKQAIIPLAGLGTRMLPLTSVIPKELMPINGKPNLEYILEECLSAGVKEFIFIISKKKMGIKKYFFNDKFYKKVIKKNKDQRIIDEYNKIKKCCAHAKKIGLKVHAGHGLDYKTTTILSRIKEIEEFNIGHFIIGESIVHGLKNTIKRFKKISNS